LALANSLWGQDGAPLQPAFIELITRHYSGVINLLDFRRDPEAARKTINQWVEEATRRRIQDLIPHDGLNALARLVVVNAVYFKGLWAQPFDRKATRNGPFHRRTLPFDPPQADFSGINGHQPPQEEALFISEGIHRAWVEGEREGN
jgi:serpin B